VILRALAAVLPGGAVPAGLSSPSAVIGDAAPGAFPPVSPPRLPAVRQRAVGWSLTLPLCRPSGHGVAAEVAGESGGLRQLWHPRQ
jgi:hypothetical protein